MARLEVVHVGSAARDVADDDPRGWRLGGGVTYAALTTARLGLRTAALVGVDADAADASELDALRDAGVDLRIVPVESSPVFHNVERPRGREQTALRGASPLTPVALPADWADAPGWSLVPVAGEVGDAWVDTIPSEAVVALGWQGLLRRITPGRRVERLVPGPRRLLQRAELVAVSHHDIDPRTRLDELTALLRPGARLLVTQGDHGGLFVTAGRPGPDAVLRYRPAAADREVDPTGAGDAFLAALLAATVRPAVLGPGRHARGADLGFAATVGALAVEATGLAGVPDLEAVRACRRRQRSRGLVVASAATLVGSLDGDGLEPGPSGDGGASG